MNAQHGRLSRIIQTLEPSPTVSYIIDSRYRLTYCNQAWDTFATSNGAPHLRGEQVIGLDLFKVIPDILKQFYLGAFARARSKGIWEFSYECSSPYLFRKYWMRVHGLGNEALFMVTNPLIYEKSHVNVAKPNSKKYAQPNGLITMCAHCRCTNRVDHPDRWDFVPAHLRLKGKALLMVSHGLCPVCRVYFYPDV